MAAQAVFDAPEEPVGEEAFEAEAFEEEAPSAAAPDHLDYGRLRLAPATSPQRGTLRRVPDEEVWIELLAELSVTVELDLVATVRRATRRAGSAATVLPPDGYSLPLPVEGFDYAWEADGPVDVLSDGRYRSVPVVERDAAVEARYVTVPREGPEAFRFAELDNPLDAPLLPGPADVYVGGDFLLTSPLRLVAPRGRAGVGLGVEEGIKVARNTRFEEEASGMLRGRLALKHEVEVEVQNLLGRLARVEVRERVPVTREGEEDIEVEVTGADPPWSEWEPELEPGVAPLDGGYRWDVTVEPGGKRALSATWVITIPSKQELVGGNRREV